MEHVTWQTALELYSAREAARGVSERHQCTMRRVVLDFKAHSGCNLDAVTAAHVETWLDSWTQEHTRNGANHRRRLLCAYMEWCKKRHFISSNPTEPVDPYRAERVIRRNLSPREYGQVHRVAAAPLADLLDWLLLTGCRVNEALTMQPEHIGGEPCCWTMEERKAGDQLRIPLGPELLAILERRPVSRPIWRKEFSERGLRNEIHAACAAARVAHFGPHTLRHCAASWAQSGGVSIQTIAAMLGHASERTSWIYAHGDRTQLVAQGQLVVAGILNRAIA